MKPTFKPPPKNEPQNNARASFGWGFPFLGDSCSLVYDYGKEKALIYPQDLHAL